jgi:serine/threonine protein kinase
MQQIGRYLVIRELGRGAMGVVFEAHDPLIGRTVAVKTIRLDVVGNPSESDQLQERLFREARSAGTLSHPGIVVIHDLGRHEKLAYIAMERVDGPTLEQILAAGRPGTPETLNILRQTAAALDHAHENGVVHRDIKPGNLMLHKGATWKITDFGIAKITTTQQITQTQLTQTGRILGTPSYMSPEHISAQPVDARTDQFSLAVIAFELLTGQKPFEADTLAGLVHQIVYAERPSAKSIRPDLSGAADAVLKRGLAKNAADRYPSCTAFVDALDKGLLVVPAPLPVCKVCGATLAEGQTQCSSCARQLGPDTNSEKAFGIAPQQRPVQAPVQVVEPPESVSSPPPAQPTAVSNDPTIQPRVASRALIGAVAGAVLTVAAITTLVVFLGKRSSVNTVVERNVPTAVSTPPQPAATPVREPEAPHPAVKVPARSKAPEPAVKASRRIEADPVAPPPAGKQVDNPDKSPEPSVVPTPPVTKADPAAEAQTAYAAKDYARVRALAEGGNAFAQADLGTMYLRGEGVRRNDKQAVAWFRRAADLGNAGGQYGLGLAYLLGRGVPKDDEQAVAWYRKAADGGAAPAQSNLGYMYEYGFGVPKDRQQAIDWYRKAAKQGIYAAKAALKRLNADQ